MNSDDPRTRADSPGSPRRVVITGLGAVTPLGLTAPVTWEAMLAGRSGVGPITLFDARDFEVRIGGEVKDFRPGEHIPAKELRHMDRTSRLAWVAAHEAVRDADLAIGRRDAQRVGVVCGSAAGGMESLLRHQAVLESRGAARVTPLFLPHFMVGTAPGVISLALGLEGPSLGVSTACASGNHAVGEAYLAVARGDADAMLAAGVDACLLPVLYAGFINMRALSGRNDEPGRASRPFDRDRDGFVVAEGAAVLVLEEMEHARARGARVYCEIVGYASGNDAFHLVHPRDEGAGAANVMRAALAHARETVGMLPRDVGYVNAHGTSTPVNDRLETLAIKQVFGDRAGQLAVSSTKSMTGHMFGAAGAVEALACAMALHTGWLPPTINYETPDPECDLDYVPNQARRWQPTAALSNSFGLGGHNASLVFRAFG